MGLFARTRSVWRSLRRGPALDEEMEEEFRFHLERRTEDLVAQGFAPEEAARRARLEFGSVDRYREEGREALGLRLYDRLRGDLRYAARSLRRTPGFTLAAVLILALGIGMSTTVFSVFKTVLVDRLPIAAQNRVVVMHTLDRSGRNLDAPFAYLRVIRSDSALFRGVAGVFHLGSMATPFMNGNAPIRLVAAAASANYFRVLGMRPVLGRFFRREDGEQGAPRVMVLSYAAWQGDFAGDPGVISRGLIVPSTQKPIRVVGVAPPGFDYPAGADAWMPLPQAAGQAQVDIIARLAPNVTTGMARAGLFALTQRVNPFSVVPHRPGQRSADWAISGVAAHTFADTVLGHARPAILIVALAAALLLLIACFNVGNLVLVRLLDRTRAIAVRLALGATRGEILRSFTVESAVLGALGGVLGWLTAITLLRVLRAVAPAGLPRIDMLGASAAPLIIAIGITVLAMLLFGLLPSLLASRARPYEALRSDTHSGTESRSGRRVRHWLLAAQIALTVMMLSGAGLLARTLSRLESVDLGYQPDHLSFLYFTYPRSSLPNDARAFAVARRLVDRFEATPGVVAASPIEEDPFKGQSFYIMKLARADQPVTERGHNPFVPFDFVGTDFFRAFRIPIVRGRGFDAGDTKGSQKVVVINASLAKQLWPGEDAIGKRLVSTSGQGGIGETPYTVVGIAQDTRLRELRTEGPVVYFDWTQIPPWWEARIAVRTTRPLAAMLPALGRATHDVDPDLVIWKTRTMDQLLAGPLARPRFSALLLAAFSIMALLLSAIGLYGVLSSGVRRQTHDIGVRIALGAPSGSIRRRVVGQALAVVGIGALLGFAGALAASRLLRSMLFDVSPTDPMTLAGVCVLLLAVAAVAAHLPSRRAARVDPVEALRSE